MSVRTEVARAGGTVRELPLYRALYPFRAFIGAHVSGGLLLLAATVVALVWVNTPWGGSYERLWEAQLTIGTADHGHTDTLRHWINDGLMAIFFFVVGLEIKREVLVGELSSLRGAALPAGAALGGMVLPALIYAGINIGGAGAVGWGIPMATDIAFAVGLLILLGDRVPVAARIFLTAVAIVDDIGAVLVIALFYTGAISWGSLALAAGLLAALVACNRAAVHQPAVYAILGIGVWLAVLESGVHATVAGVLVAMTVPTRSWIDVGELVNRGRVLLGELERSCRGAATVLSDEHQQTAIQELEELAERAETPLQHLEHSLNGWVAYAIVPLFALANAGVALDGDWAASLTDRVTLGVAAGLVVGKPIGITLATWLAVRSNLSALPAGVTWRHVHGLAWLAGIGFTMSLFVTGLAFGEGDQADAAKVGILGASLLAGLVCWTLLVRSGRGHSTADGAEGGRSPRRAAPAPGWG